MNIMGKVLLFILSVSILTLSCDTTGSKSVLTKSKKDSAFPINIQVGGEFGNLDLLRNQVNTLIDYRIGVNPDPLAFVTYAYWYPEFVFSDGKMSEEFQYLGYWVKFEDDFTYTYGQYDEKHGSGRYHFRLDDNSLVMLDDDPSLEPKIWIANHNGEIIALVGQHDYEINNGIQMKLVPQDTRPAK